LDGVRSLDAEHEGDLDQGFVFQPGLAAAARVDLGDLDVLQGDLEVAGVGREGTQHVGVDRAEAFRGDLAVRAPRGVDQAVEGF